MKGKRRLVLVFSLCLCLCACIETVSVAAARTYYSRNQLGFRNGCYNIMAVKGNKVTYRTAAEGSDPESKAGPKKTAKLTSKTRYYFGNNKRYFRACDKLNGDYSKEGRIKWVYRVSKSHFIKQIKKCTYGYMDVVMIKNGKVTALYTKMEVAG